MTPADHFARFRDENSCLSEREAKVQYDWKRRIYEEGTDRFARYASLVVPGPAPQYGFVPASTEVDAADIGTAAKVLLSADVEGVFDAISFTMRQHGKVLNSHLTVVWRGLGIRSHRQATRLLAKFNKEVAAWLRVGDVNVPRERQTRRSFFGADKHFYVYVHENSANQGLHTHQLMLIPPGKAREFEFWSREALTRLAGRLAPEPYAIHLSPRTKRGGFMPRGKTNDDQVRNCWRWFRYITKSLSAEIKYAERTTGLVVPVRDALRLFPYSASLPIYATKVAGCSENIGVSARRAARFETYRDVYLIAEYGKLYNGSELDDFKQAADEARRQAELDEVMSTLRI